MNPFRNWPWSLRAAVTFTLIWLAMFLIVHTSFGQLSTGKITFLSGNTGYLELLNYANETGPIVIHDGQTLSLPLNQTFIIIFTPHNPATEFRSWQVLGEGLVYNASAYMTTLVLDGDVYLIAFTNLLAPSVPTPEFDSRPILLALCSVVVLPLLRVRSRR